MAIIHKSFQRITNSDDFGGIQNLVNNYWGSAENERAFVLPFWKMREMLSVTGEVALRVRDIENIIYVNAEWIVFGEDMEDLLSDPVRADEIYFVLDESTFLQLKANIPTLDHPLSTIVILGRLAKDTPTSTTVNAFIVAAYWTPIGPGSSGDGTISGAKIPPPPPPPGDN